MTTISPCMATVGDTAAMFLLDAVVKATLLVVTAYLATTLVRRSSAAIRHRIWSTTFGCLLLLPVLSVLLPDLRIPIVPQVAARQSETPVLAPSTSPINSASAEPDESQTSRAFLEELLKIEAPIREEDESLFVPDEHEIANSPQPVGNPSSGTSPRMAVSFSWPLLIVIVWLAGAVLTLVPVGLGLVRNRTLAHDSEKVVAHRPRQAFARLRRQLGIRRNIRLLETRKLLVPMTWGILRPVVLVPGMWREWSHDRQRIVLLHELAHVKRWDTFCQLLARFACAFYWFHPLVWHLLRRLRAEREMACDDCVLMAGESPTDYASHILEIARDYRTLTLVAAVAMAQPTGLETRVRAMLDKSRSRLPINVATAWAILAGAAILLVGVAMASPSTSLPVEPRTAISAARSQLLTVEPSATLSGHASCVWMVGFDAQGHGLISTGRDGTVKVWNLPREEECSGWAAFEQQDEVAKSRELHSAAVTDDGKRLAVGGSDSLITVWDVAEGEKLFTLEGHTGAILGLAFSPDGKRLVSGGIDRILRVWDMETGEPVHEGYDGNSFRIQAVAVSPDGEIIISGDRDNVVKLWKMDEKRYLSCLPPDGSVLAVACAANNKGLAAGLDHGRIVMWTGTVGMQSKRQILSGHRGDVTALAFAPDGSFLASTGIDGALVLWDVTTGRKIATVHAHLGGARCLAFSPDGNRLVTGGEDREVRVWDVKKLKEAGAPAPPRTLVKEPNRSLQVARFEAEVSARIKMLDGVFLARGSGGSWSPDGKQLAFGTSEGGVEVLDLETGRQSTLAEAGRTPAWAPHGNVIAYVRGEPGEEEIWLKDLSRDKTVRLIEGRSPAWHSDGTALIFAGHDNTLNAVSWLPDGNLSAPRVIARDVQACVTVAPDGRHLAYFEQNRIVTIAYQSGKASHVPHVFEDESGCLAWSPDGRLIACGAPKSGLQIFDSTGRPPMRVIRTHVAHPAWSPDGQRIAFDVELAGNDEIWMLETAAFESLFAFHTEHHPRGAPAYLDVKLPFEPQGELVSLDLALQPDPKFPTGALGNPLDDLFDLPRGEQTLAGVSFRIGEYPIQLGNEYQQQAPDKAVGIPIQQNVARIYVLHGTGYADPYLGNRRSDTIEKYVPRPFRSMPFDGVADGTVIAYYRVRYADGGDQWIAVTEGDDVRDWCSWESPSPSRGIIAWRTRNELTRVHGHPICVFAGAWQNPHPERKVATIEYISAGTRAVPFCAAITVEKP